MITLNKLAEHFHYTPEHCSRLIKQTTGHTFLALLKNIKLRHAEALLLNTTLGIEEIGFMVGYENSSTLISLFKKEYHMTPGQFRKAAQQEHFT